MRTVLAIDVSTRSASVAVVRGDEVALTASYTSERSHNSRIFEPMAEALEKFSDISALVVGTGPGSYVGIRIGISAATGVSLARGLPVVGVPSLLGLVSSDQAIQTGRVANGLVIGDARQGKIWTAEIVNSQLAADPVVHLPEDALKQINADPNRRLVTIDPESPIDIPGRDVEVVLPSAAALGSYASSLSDSEFAEMLESPVVPIYLAPPFVTKPRKIGR